MDPLATPSASSASTGVSSKSEMTNHPRKTRSACNRCHTQKLKCVRNLGEQSCERCLKLHTSCRYGQRAPRASLKPPSSATRHQMTSVAAPSIISMLNCDLNATIMDGTSSEWTPSPNVGVDIAEDQVATYPGVCYPMQGGDVFDMHNIWPDPLCEPDCINRYGLPEMDLLNQQLHAIFPPADADNYPRLNDHDDLEASPALAIRKLADLNVELYECALNLPFMPKAGVDASRIASYGRSARKAKIFAIDELFRLTNEFIDIVKSFSFSTRDSLSSKDQSSCVLPVVENTQQLSHQCQFIARGAGLSTSFSNLDEGTMLMIMSCHCRLTETYQSIFEMIQACIEFSAIPQIDKGAGIILPRLQVGSHTAPQVKVDANTVLESGTSEMYMLLITIISGSLCKKLADVMGVRDEAAMGSKSTPQCHMVATIRERTDRLGRSIDAAKHLLQRFSPAPI